MSAQVEWSIAELRAYVDEVRRMSGAELAEELQRVVNPGRQSLIAEVQNRLLTLDQITATLRAMVGDD